MKYTTLQQAQLDMPKPLTRGMQNSVMSRPDMPEPSVTQQDLPLETVTPEDFVPNPKAILGLGSIALKNVWKNFFKGSPEEYNQLIQALRKSSPKHEAQLRPILMQQPSLYIEKATDALRNTNRGVVPVASNGELTNRALTPSELNAQYLDQVGFGGGIKPLKVAAGGPAVKGLSYGANDLIALQDALRDYTKPRMLPPDRANALASVLKTAEEPGAVTHVLSSNFDEPTAAFVVTPGKEMGMDTGYLAHLVSLTGQPGTGKQALRTLQLQGPVEFISTPQSQGYYQKLLREGFPGLQEHPDLEFGHTRYMLKGTK